MFRKFAFIKTKKWLEIKRFQATENPKRIIPTRSRKTQPNVFCLGILTHIIGSIQIILKTWTIKTSVVVLLSRILYIIRL